jgi:hypothetical protein
LMRLVRRLRECAEECRERLQVMISLGRLDLCPQAIPAL